MKRVTELSGSRDRPGGLFWNFVTFLESKLLLLSSVSGMWLQEGKNMDGASFSGVREMNTGGIKSFNVVVHGYCLCFSACVGGEE